MSKPQTIYRITQQAFDPSDDIQQVTDISDMDNLIDDALGSDVITLIGSGKPKEMSTIDDSEDPMTVIKAQQFIIEFTSGDYNMNTFASGSDSRWFVHSYIGSNTIFKGYLNIDDLQQDFMPDPNIVVLTANDGLGPLKDIPLTDFDERNPSSYNRLIDYIAWCLGKTGLQLQINCAFNIKNDGLVSDIRIPSTDAQHFFDINYLDAKTFEDKIGSCVNCYRVLKIILGEEAEIFQHKGMWWIIRTDEREHPTRGLYISAFDYQGTFIGILGEKIYEKEIGKDAPYTILFSNEQTKVSATRPRKSVELDYMYDLPLEIVDNIDFSRGGLITSVSPTEKNYNLDSWLFSQWKANGQGPGATGGGSLYIRRFFINDYETERYAVIEKGTNQNSARSRPVFVHAGDKVNIFTDFKLNIDVGDVLVNQFSVELVGDDGTYWYLFSDGDGGGWAQYPSLPWTQLITMNFDGTGLNMAEWQTVGSNSQEIPVNGKIYIHLVQSGGATTEVDFSNLRFDYLPKINGSHAKYTGQSQTVTQSGNYKAKRVEQVYMSDSPKRLFKGALHQVLIYNSIIIASVQFSSGTLGIGFSALLGDKSYLFFSYQRILMQGSAGSNGFFVVKEVIYVPSGDYTAVSFYTYGAPTVTNGEIATVTISEASFKLVDPFYNAAVFPDGPPTPADTHPYSEIQVFDVWNQFKTDKRIFDAVCQGLQLQQTDADGQANAHLLYKWFLRDVNENTNDRIFKLLTFTQDFRLGEWSGLLREVASLLISKDYTGRTFKYLT